MSRRRAQRLLRELREQKSRYLHSKRFAFSKSPLPE
jgi:hypothetical protein